MTIFEDGDWRLVDCVWKKISIMHKCPPKPTPCTTVIKTRLKSDGWWYYAQNGVCNSCLAAAPDKLVGLQTLTNWKR